MKSPAPHRARWLYSGLLAASLLATSLGLGTPAQAYDQKYPIFMLGGNQFIIRKTSAGHGKIYLRAYRRSGQQWEDHSIATINPRARHHGNSIPERIYYNGQRIGSIVIDLDNPMNTDMHLNPSR